MRKASGIRVRQVGDPISNADGVLFLLDEHGAKTRLPNRVRRLETLSPPGEIAGLRRDTPGAYGEFRTRYWRWLGNRSNVATLAQLRKLGWRSPGVTLLTAEPQRQWSAAMAVAELLGAVDQRPTDWGRYGYVYVVELKPRGKGKKPEIYVGDTGKSPEERFSDHVFDRRTRRGGARTASKCAHERGIRLAYELFWELNPLPRGEDACERATELRRDLEPHYDICGSPECMDRLAKPA